LIDVYADLLFLVDLCMDLACICACERLTGVHCGKLRRLAAAFIGGAYSVCSLFIPEGAFSFICALLSWQLICLVAFHRRGDGLVRHVKLSLCFLVMNLLLGGAVSAVFGLFGRLADICLPDAEYKYADGRLRIIFLSLAAACFILRLFVARIHRLRLDGTAYVKITEFDRSVILSAICDTGNFLSEPLTGTPCTVISSNDLVSLGGEELLSFLDADAHGKLRSMGIRVALIPAKTVSGGGLMPGFFTKIELLDSEKKKIREFETVVTVSSTGAPGAGVAILPGCLCG
jgi:hypothetical protein